jgi:hypothetical protein
VDKALISLATAYEIPVQVDDAGGIHLEKREDVAFRACERAPAPITVDGDLADWQLDKRMPIPFEREFTNWGKPISGPADLSGTLYTLWDDAMLYFAAVVKDDSAVARANDVGIWEDDNIMFGLHPWGWRMGESLHSGYYREHLGLCLDGVARIFRVGNVAGGPTTAEGAKIAVRRTADGYIYEWAYPRACVFPLDFRPGSRFRMSALLFDRDWNGDKLSALGGMSIGGFNSNVDARPVKWREFVFTN